MALQSLTCPPPIKRRFPPPTLDHDLLHEAIALHEKGQAGDALSHTLRHMFPSHEIPDLAQETFTFVQGSSRVSLWLDDGVLTVRVPLVRIIDDSLTTAALRFLLTKVSGPGQLYQPVLRGDEVYLEFSDRLSRLHPQKVREVVRQMPFLADAHDDWMTSEFVCEPIDREPLEPLSDEEMERAVATWTTHWSEVEEMLKESQRKRSMWFLNEMTAYAYHHVQQALPFTGYWWSRIVSAADVFNDSDESPDERERALAKCAREMRGLTPEQLGGSLGHARYALTPQNEGGESVFTSSLGPGKYVDTIRRLHNAGRYMDAGLAFFSTYAFLLARFDWEEKTERQLLKALEEASERPWREATTRFFDRTQAILDSFEEEEEEAEEEEEEASE